MTPTSDSTGQQDHISNSAACQCPDPVKCPRCRSQTTPITAASEYRGVCRCGHEVTDTDPQKMADALSEHFRTTACGFDISTATNGRFRSYGW